MRDFFDLTSARKLGFWLTLACLASALIARCFGHAIDLTQIIMMILQTALVMISYGAGAAHMGNAVREAEKFQEQKRENKNLTGAPRGQTIGTEGGSNAA